MRVDVGWNLESPAHSESGPVMLQVTQDLTVRPV